MRCQREGCGQAAAGRLAILIPGRGGPLDARRCIRGEIGVLVCVAHFVAEKLRVAEWCEIVRVPVEALARGKAPPDFARAYLELEHLQ